MLFLKLIYLITFVLICKTHSLRIEERLTYLENVVKNQNIKVERLEKLEKEIESKNIIIERHETMISELKSIVSSRKSGIEEAERNVANPSSLASSDKVIGNDSRSVDARHGGPGCKEKLQKDNRINKRQVTNAAFHAYMTGQRCFHDHEVLVFDVATINFGGAYNRQDGIYIAPSDGYYVFTWTITSSTDEWFKADLIVNGVSIGWITSPVTNGNAASGTVLAHLDAGDHVFIKRLMGSGCTIIDTYNRASFTGYKLFD